MSVFPVTYKSIAEAKLRIKPFVYRTPLLKSNSINEIAGAELFFKCENLQRVGAFKMRGATNAILKLTDSSMGVATHSSGNHAQALALSARIQGVSAFIVMPDNAPQVKINAVKDFGAEVTFCAPTLQARENTLGVIVNKTGAAFIPPYDHWDVIEGQGTCVLEIMEDCLPDVLLVPVGGGGLLAGSLIAAKSIHPQLKVYGCEPEGANDAFLSYQSGIRISEHTPHTIADGLLTTLGERNFEVIKSLCDGIYTINDVEIVKAMKLIFERLKLVVEPSAAVGLAVALKYRKEFRGKKVAIILSGGNVDLKKLSDLF